MAEAGILAALVRFAERLRAAGVPCSTVETVDAAAALTAIDLRDREVVREALAATLVKRPIDRSTFERVFPTFASASGVSTRANQGPPREGEGDANGTGGEPTDGIDDDALVAALQAGDDGDLRSIAADAVARHGGITSGAGPSSERYHVNRVLRRLELSRLLQKAVREARQGGDGGLGERLAADAVRARAAGVKAAVTDQVRRRLAEMYEPDAQTDAGTLADVDLLTASARELEQLRLAVRPLARLLAVRLARRRRRRRRGRLDVRRTVRRSLATGGVPFAPAYRARSIARPDVVVLCDVSGSMATFASFSLTLLHALRHELASLRCFAFTDGVDEVTDRLGELGDRLEVGPLLHGTRVVADDGHSDYGRALTAFVERYGDSVTPRTTVLVLGDARTNARPDGVDALAAVAGRVRRVYWLNPEPRVAWGAGDSAMDAYRPHIEAVLEVRTVAQLAQAVAAIA